jgi:3-phenylpropionate/cinnamic acid dioxygenase small subunit
MSVAAKPPAIRVFEEFLFRQAELLDGRRWDEWIDLFADDGVYWMPLKEEQQDAENYPSIFFEDKALMAARVGRLRDVNAWGQQPVTRTSHLIGNVRLDGGERRQGEIIVRSNFTMAEFRRDVLRHHAGTYTHHLRPDGDGFRIALQRVDLINADGIHEYNLQVYV